MASFFSNRYAYINMGEVLDKFLESNKPDVEITVLSNGEVEVFTVSVESLEESTEKYGALELEFPKE